MASSMLFPSTLDAIEILALRGGDLGGEQHQGDVPALQLQSGATTVGLQREAAVGPHRRKLGDEARPDALLIPGIVADHQAEHHVGGSARGADVVLAGMSVGLLGELDQPRLDRGPIGRGDQGRLTKDVPCRKQRVHRVDDAAGVGPAGLGNEPGARDGVLTQRGDVGLRLDGVVGEEDVVGADIEGAREVPGRPVAFPPGLHRRERGADQRSQIHEVLLADADPLAFSLPGAATILPELGAAALDIEQRLGMGDVGSIEKRLLAGGGGASGQDKADESEGEQSGPRHR